MKSALVLLAVVFVIFMGGMFLSDKTHVESVENAISLPAVNITQISRGATAAGARVSEWCINGVSHYFVSGINGIVAITVLEKNGLPKSCENK